MWSYSMHKSKAVAFLGMFTALIATLRPIGLGAIGMEPMWFALILISRVMGLRLSIVLAISSMTLSALLTGGVGPWLPWQIFAAMIIAGGTSLIPASLRGRRETLLLAAYGVVAAELYGLIMDLSFWPLALGSGTQLSFSSDISWSANAMRFLKYHFIGALAWDVPRAILTSTLILIAGPNVLFAIRRSFRKATLNGRVIRP